MSEFRRMLAVSISVTVMAAALWGLATDWTVTHEERTAVSLDRPAAAALLVIAAMCWVHLWEAAHDRDKRVLIRTLSRTVPTRRVP